ncbi:hypothetical protein O9G_002789 [Rozella allomycis CSF55]|uniref:Altered inheritance of mitochondria protein 41 n=1 Tax=Rozella allomycis (strain CSF55) TaxID=988480 RepID=A0A075AQP6_ROZAC|nr:hypothetical protein O9G_002789 [Rozella allomycis CSF55]|eukprot:EPZ30912.1 hypothetical protein O9G_002789 [Rozella allomycis CSF55]
MKQYFTLLVTLYASIILCINPQPRPQPQGIANRLKTSWKAAKTTYQTRKLMRNDVAQSARQKPAQSLTKTPAQSTASNILAQKYLEKINSINLAGDLKTLKRTDEALGIMAKNAQRNGMTQRDVEPVLRKLSELNMRADIKQRETWNVFDKYRRSAGADMKVTNNLMEKFRGDAKTFKMTEDWIKMFKALPA